MKKLISFAFLLVFVLYLSGCDRNSASIGLIGGADGPTAILVSSNINWLIVCIFTGLIVAAFLIAFAVCRNKNNH